MSAPDHIVVVTLENRDYSQIIGSPDAPFINSLASQGMLFTNYSGITHPSQPNYFALFSGSTQGVTDDYAHTFPATPSLAGELQQAGLSFVGYAETGSPQEHNTWLSFGDSQNDGLDFGRFPSDFSQLPTVAFVMPNAQDDMHDGTVVEGDAWLNANLGAYAQWAKDNNSILIVTFDENDDRNPNRVATIVVGAGVAAGTNDQPANHYALLRTIESMYGLPLLGATSGAPVLNFYNTSSAMSSSQILTSFSGISDPNNYPPQNALAIGPAYTLSVESSKVEWTDLSGGGSKTDTSLYSIFSSLDPTQVNALFDARTVYDGVNNRFVLTAANLNKDGSTNIDVAVSKDSNPNDGWNVGSLNTSLMLNGQLTSADMPYLSVDGKNIYITSPQYNASGGAFQGTEAFVIGDTSGPGGGIYGGGTMTVTSQLLADPAAGVQREIAVPNGLTYLVSTHSSGTQTNLTLNTYDPVTNTFGTPQTLALGNSDQGNGSGNFTAGQEGTSKLLDAGDGQSKVSHIKEAFSTA